MPIPDPCASVEPTVWQRQVSPAAIETELAALWNELSRAGPCVMRTLMSNLVVYADTVPAAAAGRCPTPNVTSEASPPEPLFRPCSRTAGSTLFDDLGVVARLHPSRIILVRRLHDGEGLHANISITAYGQGDARTGIEQIVIDSSDLGGRLTSVVRPLILGDLPTSIFWAAGSCPAGNLIEGLLPFGRQLVYDSLEWEAAEPAIEAVTQLTDSAHQRLDLGDLSWRRMKPLRRALVQAIDPALVPDLGTLRGITIDHSPERNGMIARLLLGWIGARLGWRPVSRNGSEWRLRADGREVRAAISSGSTDAQLRVRLETDRVPNGAAVELTATDAEILVSYGMSAAPFAMVAPKRSRADLIAAELRTLRLDNLLYEALAFLRSAQAVD